MGIEIYNIQIGSYSGVMYWSMLRLSIHYPRIAKHIYNQYRKGIYHFDIKKSLSINLV
jgi:hypothetical protein